MAATATIKKHVDILKIKGEIAPAVALALLLLFQETVDFATFSRLRI